MTGVLLRDDQIALMTWAERRALADRLIAGDSPDEVTRRRRRNRFVLIAGGCSLLLVPWLGVLAVTVPHRYVAPHWTLTWVGFDAALFVALAATTLLAWRRRRLLVPVAAACATLLVCDAWFDITTSHPTDYLLSVGSAVLVELPLAVVLARASLLVLRHFHLELPGAVRRATAPARRP
ncbi:hypothetical protein [Actinomycetospora termitidis]|uniref:Uncharacterized protein n=1 Tax=Actinomycetospora termitidis TaxID=3053470 RepID=A0ABT7ME93_9PSEU|nr:hypothetical protein [Actinomycetospora sp. Odt1-22]MDL5158504.1 hypothetical protein [Actinomycetospora sp. Odt1-22]